MALAAALTVLDNVVALAGVAISAPRDVAGWAGGWSLAVVPMALGAAVLRYPLCDLDLLVSELTGRGARDACQRSSAPTVCPMHVLGPARSALPAFVTACSGNGVLAPWPIDAARMETQ